MPVVDSCIVFVYGTLLRGMRLHGYMDAARYVGEATVHGRLYDIGAFPAVVLGDCAVRVAGEIYEVDSATLSVLDLVEGFDPVSDRGMYVRRTVIAQDDRGEIREVQVYVAGDLDLSRVTKVETGSVADYRTWRQMRTTGESQKDVHHE